MTAFKAVITYLATGGIFFLIDLVWLSMMNPRLYKPQLAAFMGDKVAWAPAIIFYLLFPLALLVLVILPAVERGSWLRALWWGGLLGMAAYATYDLTNLATIKNWPLSITIIDIAWGTALSALTAVAAYAIARLL